MWAGGYYYYATGDEHLKKNLSQLEVATSMIILYKWYGKASAQINLEHYASGHNKFGRGSPK